MPWATRRVDNAVSKTINLPVTATPDDERASYTSTWRRELKGVTVFREGCKGIAVLSAARARRSKPLRTTRGIARRPLRVAGLVASGVES